MTKRLLVLFMVGCGAKVPPSDLAKEISGDPSASPDSAEAVQATVSGSARGLMQGCYERRLQELPALQGRVVLVISIKDGAVTEAHIEENQTGDSLLGQCMTESARGISFSPGVTADVFLPFVFSAS